MGPVGETSGAVQWQPRRETRDRRLGRRRRRAQEDHDGNHQLHRRPGGLPDVLGSF